MMFRLPPPGVPRHSPRGPGQRQTAGPRLPPSSTYALKLSPFAFTAPRLWGIVMPLILCPNCIVWPNPMSRRKGCYLGEKNKNMGRPHVCRLIFSFSAPGFRPGPPFQLDGLLGRDCCHPASQDMEVDFFIQEFRLIGIVYQHRPQIYPFFFLYSSPYMAWSSSRSYISQVGREAEGLLGLPLKWG